MKIVIVTPAKNEANRIESLLSGLRKHKLDIIVVDDGSVDETQKIALKYTPYILVHLINLGKGSALKTGCDFAFDHLKADAVILIDSDGQHSPKEISLFCKQLRKGNQLVLGIRNFQHMPILRQLLNGFLSLMVRLIYGRYIPDIPSGYKAFSKKMYQYLQWKANGYEVEMEIATKIAKMKLPFCALPIQTIYKNKSTEMNFDDALHSFFKIVLSKFDMQKL